MTDTTASHGSSFPCPECGGSYYHFSSCSRHFVLGRSPGAVYAGISAWFPGAIYAGVDSDGRSKWITRKEAVSRGLIRETVMQKKLDPLPASSAARKMLPIASGCLDYFPDALVAVAGASYIANEYHNPGSPVHWDRSKSPNEADCLMRHFMARGTRDTDGIRHSAKVAWRALALLQKEIEAEAIKDK